ncbi:UNVERIFIED_CONTAM: hypothetical protein HDU68_000304 [Siphonaria sp. JEL0065]|nr:hypothetical protein HDU68_000304 [Siphonaria sp. JEL0065]
MVSKAHAMLSFENDSVVLADLGSSNGTALNGLRVRPTEKAIVKAGDTRKRVCSAVLLGTSISQNSLIANIIETMLPYFSAEDLETRKSREVEWEARKVEKAAVESLHSGDQSCKINFLQQLRWHNPGLVIVDRFQDE